MRKSTSPTVYRRAFFQRVRSARNIAGKTPAEMAALLGMSKDTYHRYETRTLLPHHMIPVFCELTGVTPDWIVTGRAMVHAVQDDSPFQERQAG